MQKTLLVVFMLMIMVNCKTSVNEEQTDGKLLLNSEKENNDLIELGYEMSIPVDTFSFIDLSQVKWLLLATANHNEILKYCLSSEIRILRNEMFARKGYIFKDTFLNSFFKRESWYKPQFHSVDSIVFSHEEKILLDSLIFYEKLNKNLTIDSIHSRVNQTLISSFLKNEFVNRYIIKRFVDHYSVMTANKILHYDTLDNNYYHFVFNTWDGSNSSYNDDRTESLYFCSLNDKYFPTDVVIKNVFYDTFEKNCNNIYSFLTRSGNKETKMFYSIDEFGKFQFNQ